MKQPLCFYEAAAKHQREALHIIRFEETAYHQNEVLYLIKPQEYTLCVMIYQACGLDTKRALSNADT